MVSSEGMVKKGKRGEKEKNKKVPVLLIGRKGDPARSIISLPMTSQLKINILRKDCQSCHGWPLSVFTTLESIRHNSHHQ